MQAEELMKAKELYKKLETKREFLLANWGKLVPSKDIEKKRCVMMYECCLLTALNHLENAFDNPECQSIETSIMPRKVYQTAMGVYLDAQKVPKEILNSRVSNSFWQKLEPEKDTLVIKDIENILLNYWPSYNQETIDQLLEIRTRIIDVSPYSSMQEIVRECFQLQQNYYLYVDLSVNYLRNQSNQSYIRTMKKN